MGVIAELVRVVSTTLKKWHAAPGTAIVVTAKGLGGAALETEIAHPPGIFGRPPKDFHGVFLPVGQGRRYGVIVAGLNYSLNINISAGETAVYSTDANGTVKARMDFDATGKVALTNTAGKSLKTILKTLIEHVRDLVTINCVVGAPVTLNPATIALLNADIVELEALLK